MKIVSSANDLDHCLFFSHLILSMVDDPDHKSLRPQEVCPNCWGEQFYEDRFHAKVKDLQLEVNNHRMIR